jgi:DNA-binding GntR family transcriptional regulator
MREGFPSFDRPMPAMLHAPTSPLRSLSSAGSSCKAKETAAVYLELKSWLVDYRFLPGERLHIADLAERLGVSSTPVREALNRLHAEELLLSVPNKGFFSKVLNLREMVDLLDTAKVLLRSAIDSHDETRTDIAEAISAITDAASAPKPHANLAHAVETLFECIVNLARNEVMTAVMRNVNDRTHYVRMLDLAVPGRIAEVGAEMSALTDALGRRDRRGAADTLDLHFGRLSEAMPELVKEGISRRYTA